MLIDLAEDRHKQVWVIVTGEGFSQRGKGRFQMSEMEPEPSDPLILICRTCAQTFSSREMLSAHLMEVHGEEGLASEVPESP